MTNGYVLVLRIIIIQSPPRCLPCIEGDIITKLVDKIGRDNFLPEVFPELYVVIGWVLDFTWLTW